MKTYQLIIRYQDSALDRPVQVCAQSFRSALQAAWRQIPRSHYRQIVGFTPEHTGRCRHLTNDHRRPIGGSNG